MLIKDIYATRKPVISFEIFPPKKDTSIDSIYKTLEDLNHLQPDFISVTYGALGSSKGKTTEIASVIKNKYNIEALAHLTCVTSTKKEIDDTLTKLKNNNINNILALRGDLPEDKNIKFPNPLNYKYAKDLISHINSKGGYSIGAACYPEGHIECSDKKQDLIYLKEKLDCGVDFMITQLFFDNNLFYNFKNELERMSIKTPISVGIMPVLNKKQIERIVNLSGASIPIKFQRILDRYEYNKDALKEAAIAYATEQIIDLLSWGVDGIHIYTMNKPEVAVNIVNNVSIIRETLKNNGK